MNDAASHGAVIFGLDPLWLSSAILVVTYAALISEKLNRTVAALAGGGLVIVCGIIDQDQAIAGIDFNTIALLIGMMIIVAITRTSGVFEYVAVWSAKKVKAEPFGILIMLSLVTAVFSAFPDNLTTVLLVVPVVDHQRKLVGAISFFSVLYALRQEYADKKRTEETKL